MDANSSGGRSLQVQSCPSSCVLAVCAVHRGLRGSVQRAWHCHAVRIAELVNENVACLRMLFSPCTLHPMVSMLNYLTSGTDVQNGVCCAHSLPCVLFGAGSQAPP
jgi:hypothetical protein